MTSVAEIARLLAFVAFLSLGIVAARARDEEHRRRAVLRFVVITLGMALLSGVTQIDAWPFTTYTLAAFRPRARVELCHVEIVGLDAAGSEWQADPLSWSPVYHSILQYWLEADYPKLARKEQEEVLVFLGQRLERSRADLAAGRRIGFERRAGAAYDPYWWLLRRPAHVSPEPFRGMRIYRSCAIPEDQLAYGAEARRNLLAETSFR